MNRTPNRKVKTATSKKRGPRKPRIVEHPLSSSTNFTSREIGWLNFNRRVLAEAEDSRNPLLERVKFLSICASNLDEFFMKRVGGLKRQVAYGVSAKSSDGKTPQMQLSEIRQTVMPMLKDQAHCFQKVLRPALAQQGIRLLQWPDLTVKEKEFAQKYYMKNVFPVLTPLSVDPGHPFPFISNLSTSLGITLRHPQQDEKLFARVKIPQVLSQWVKLDAENGPELRFVSLLDLIKENLRDLFPQMQVTGVMPFRLTRNADMSRDEEDAEDLLELIEEELRMRRFAEVVRLEHGPNPDPWMLKFLMEELELSEEDVYELPDDLDYTGLNIISDLTVPNLRFPPWTPAVPTSFLDEDPSQIFQVIRHSDQLIHNPFESFNATVEKFIRAAAEDPKVVAIKMTLYRTGDHSPFIRSLIRAAEMGKQVVCLVELKARFDEERNIYWAQALENAGVHVVYGIVGLKTHAKTALVVRQEAEGIKCYAHLGTGNYNVATSKFYTDMGLLTAKEEITAELVEFFHYLTGRSLKSDYKHLLIAPINMFSKFKSMIEREGDHAKQGRPAQIIAKMNNMEENDISTALYGASTQGVQIDLLVRGFCCLRPGVRGLSEKIRVMSTLGRFLEHSRVFYFRNGAQDPIDGDFFIGSADWMYRNLHARVECVVPILDRSAKEKIWEILQSYIKDQRQTWDMAADGSYIQRKSTDLGVHHHLMTQAKQKHVMTEDVVGSDPTADDL
ncbi:MAG: polyphosphate kinase 1 [Pseudobdellovibrionaceae bacterium]